MGKLTPHGILSAKVMHKRFAPKLNQFVYRQYYVMLELSDLKPVSNPIFSLNRFNLFSFYEKDHGPYDGSDLYRWCKGMLGSNGIDATWLNRVYLVTQPRILGWVFNPVSFWLCCDKEQQLRVAFAQTHNTFGEKHTYIVCHEDLRPIQDKDEIRGKKLLYVSPFFKVEGTYSFRFQNNETTFGVWIDYHVKGQKLLITSLTGKKKQNLGILPLLRMFFKIPLANFKTILLIHYQAIKLWLKNINLTRRDEFTGPKVSVCSKQKQHPD